MIHEVRHIRAFLAVARLSSFTRAAAELHISQPALTVQIRQLEEMLGIRLFDRNKRQVVLTAAGRGLVAPLERVLHDIEAVLDTSRDLAQLRRGLVTVAALPSVSAGLLALAIRAFSRQHPGVVVRVRDVVAEGVVTLVKLGEVDFGIGCRVGADRDITLHDFLVDRMCAFVPDDHPLAGRTSITLRDAAAWPLVLTARNTSVRDLVERALEAEGLEIDLACEANYMSSAVGMVRAGLGISILPASAADCASCQGVVPVAMSSPGLTRKVGLVRKAGRSLTPAAAAFVVQLYQVATGPLSYFTLLDGATPQDALHDDIERP